MMMIWLWLLLPLISLSSSLSNSSKNLIREQALKWCSQAPYETLFSLSKTISCFRNTSNDISSRGRGQHVTLAVYHGLDDLQYDCGAIGGKGPLRLRNSLSTFIFRMIQDLLKLKVRVVGDQYGGIKVNGTWRGLVGRVERGEADLGFCHLTITPSRFNAVDFLHPTLHNGRSLVFAPSRLPMVEDVFVLTFSGTLWLCFLSAVILIALFFKVSTWTHSQVRPDHDPWSWVEVILWAIAAVCQQSYSRHPKGISCRTTFLIGYLSTYLLYTGFAAGVTSLLAVQGRDIKLSFHDVIAMKLSLIVSGYTTYEFLPFSKAAPDASNHWIAINWKRIEKAKSIRNNTLFYEELLKDNRVGFGSTINLKNHLWKKVPSKMKQHYTISAIPGSFNQESFIVRKKSKYKEIFNYWLLKIREVGLLDLGLNRYVTVPNEHYNDGPGWSSAGLGNVLSAILILCAGYFLSVFILFCEMAWMHRFSSTTWEIRSKEDIQKTLAKSKGTLLVQK